MIREERSSSLSGPTVATSIQRVAAWVAVAIATMGAASRADDGAPAPGLAAEGRPAALVDLLPELTQGARRVDNGRRAGETPRAAAPHAIVRLIGTAGAGLRVTLDGSASTGPPSWYRWVQVEGPPAALDADDRPSVSVAVPSSASSLAYLLVVGNAAGSDVARVSVPVEGKGPSTPTAGLRADAGDDQIGQVGRQVTLNGLRSTPRARLGYRWIQMAGPKVVLKIEDGYVFTFVPPAQGLYQFALVVASGCEISEPDLVNVAVGVPLPPPEEPATAPAPVPMKELARAVLAQVEGGPSAGTDLAEAFEEIAFRIDLYRSYCELMVEMTGRLEGIVPADALQRSAWLQRVFAPLTARLIEQMRSEGLDLARPEGQAAEMTRPQRRALAQQLRVIAEGFRSAGGAR